MGFKPISTIHMKKCIYTFLIACSLVACKESPSDSKSLSNSTEKVTNIKDDKTKAAKAWLIKSIEDFFLSTNADQKTITTTRYNEYKSDAIGVDMDGGMTAQEFQLKWGKIYNTNYAGMGVGFLISGQDYGKVKVSKCDAKASNVENEYIFDVQIDDPEMKAVYHREIKLVESNNSFLIDDVKEFD